MGQRKGFHGESTWSIPGGHLEFGESFEKGAAREVKEETGLSVKNIRFGAVTNDYFPKDGKHYISVCQGPRFSDTSVYNLSRN